MHERNSNSEAQRDTGRIDPLNNAARESVGDLQAQQYGRRVERDRSWTVYQVFTGVPADHGRGPMTGLSRAEATDTMISLNLRAWIEPRAIGVPGIGG